MNPFAFCLQMELARGVAIGVVGPIQAFGGRVLQKAYDRGIGEFGAVPRSISGLVQPASHALSPLVLGEKLIHELTDGGFGWVWNELVLVPFVAERSGAPEVLAEFGPNLD